MRTSDAMILYGLIKQGEKTVNFELIKIDK